MAGVLPHPGDPGVAHLGLLGARRPACATNSPVRVGAEDHPLVVAVQGEAVVEQLGALLAPVAGPVAGRRRRSRRGWNIERVRGSQLLSSSSVIGCGETDPNPRRGLIAALTGEASHLAARCDASARFRARCDASANGSAVEGARVGRDVDGMLLQPLASGTIFEHHLVSGGQHDRCRHTVVIGSGPVLRGDAPAITRDAVRGAVLRSRRREVVADAVLVIGETRP